MAFSLFLLMDPIGNIPFFLSILKNVAPARQFQIILRELLIALAVMLGFHFLGDFLLAALHVTQYSVLISGGIILFLLSLKMIFPSGNGFESGSLKSVEMGAKEPFIVPLAIPLVAGPAVLAAIILYAKQDHTWLPMAAIVLAWIVSTAILLSSVFLSRVLGKKGILACERLMGLILTMMSIQMFLEGVSEYIKALK